MTNCEGAVILAGIRRLRRYGVWDGRLPKALGKHQLSAQRLGQEKGDDQDEGAGYSHDPPHLAMIG